MSEIRLFAGNFAPLSWSLCQGQLMSIAENTALFSLLGTTYGGDGQVTFALPDFRGRCAVGTGQGPGLSPYDLGQVSGNNNVTLLSVNLPPHTHTASFNVSANPATSVSPNNGYLAVANGTQSDGGTLQMAYMAGSGDGTFMAAPQVMPSGQSAPVSVTNPYLVLNFIIAVEGIYPSRS